jgi:hypothetical protein
MRVPTAAAQSVSQEEGDARRQWCFDVVRGMPDPYRQADRPGQDQCGKIRFHLRAPAAK